jgi:uncharacterized protein YecE (DUF72 family)
MGGAIRIRTSAFTAAGWPGSCYPANLKPADYLSYYATQFDTVEVDNTFYRVPSESTVRGWYAKTPPGFIFAAKFPQAITHEKVLVDCDVDVRKFLAAMDALGEKLGPLLFQFPWFPDTVFFGLDDFLARLLPFLDKLPKDHRFAVEIRNKTWLAPKLTDALRERGIALALIDQAWMPRPAEWFERCDPITADFTYIRWLGDREGIERLTKTWDKTILDCREPLREWVKVWDQAVRRGVQAYALREQSLRRARVGSGETVSGALGERERATVKHSGPSTGSKPTGRKAHRHAAIAQ